MAKIIFGQYQETCCFIQRIPPELVAIIFALLSVPDQICLSLSCRYFYSCLLSLHDGQKVHLTQLHPSETRPRLCSNVNIEKRPRIQLLRQLENNRWKYCSECWNLHRPYAWYGSSWFFWRLSQKLDRFCYAAVYGRHECMPYAGEVDICPCLTITFCDKQHLMDTMKAVQQDSHGGYSTYYNGMISHRGWTTVEDFCACLHFY